MRTYLLLMLISMFVFSCERVVDVDIEIENQKLSISAIFPQNSTHLEVLVTQALPISSTQNYKIISDASVSIYVEGTLVEELAFDDEREIYISSDLEPTAETVYHLEVRHPNFETATAVTFIPSEAEVESTTVRDFTGRPSEIFPEQNVYNFTIDLEITDPIDEVNYYHILFYQERTLLVEESDPSANTPRYFLLPFNIENENPADATIISSRDFYGAYLKDTNFNGQTVILPFSLEMLYNPELEKVENIFVEIRSIPEDYYNFYTSGYKQSQTGLNPFSNGEYPPVNSNINNGLGLFSGYSSIVRQIRL